MRFAGQSGDYVELERVSLGPSGPEPFSDQDIQFRAKVHYGTFLGEATAWIEHSSWNQFLLELRALEHSRIGEAHLLSMSPGELELTVRITDRAGHVGVEGRIGARTSVRDAVLQFGLIPLDPSVLPLLIGQFARLERRGSR